MILKFFYLNKYLIIIFIFNIINKFKINFIFFKIKKLNFYFLFKNNLSQLINI